MRVVIYPVFHPGASIVERVAGYAYTPWFAGFVEGPGVLRCIPACPTETDARARADEIVRCGR